jgi:tetratricopeptide (TPR) repeat protein
VLTQAAARFTEAARPAIELVSLCQQRHLRSRARAWARAALHRGLERVEAIALSQLLHRDRGAASLLERIVVRYPRDAQLLGVLAHAYAAWGQPYAAAKLFERAVDNGGDHAFEAADQFRLAGRFARALRLNTRVSERARRLGQRLAILLSAGSMARVVSLADTLRREGQWDSATRYRVAYAHYALGQADQAATLLRGLIDGPHEHAARSLLAVLGRAPGTELTE